MTALNKTKKKEKKKEMLKCRMLKKPVWPAVDVLCGEGAMIHRRFIQKASTTAWDYTGKPCCLWVDPACQQQEDDEVDDICEDWESAHIPARTVHVALLKDTRTHASITSLLLLTSSSSLSWSAQERVWEPQRGDKKKGLVHLNLNSDL